MLSFAKSKNHLSKFVKIKTSRNYNYGEKVDVVVVVVVGGEFKTQSSDSKSMTDTAW